MKFLQLFTIINIAMLSHCYCQSNEASAFTVDADSLKPDSKVQLKPKDQFSWTDTIVESPNKKYVIKYTKQIDMPLRRDTLELIDFSETKIDTIQEEQTRIVRVKSTYNVAVVLPFMTSLYSGKEIPAQSVRAVEFYEGIEIALDSLRREGVNLKISVFDSKKDSAGIFEVISKMEDKEWDMIIGPAHSEVLVVLAEFAKKYQIPLVSPFNNKAKIASDNHFYIQVNPSYETMASYIVNIMTKAKATNLGIRKTKYLILGMQDDSLKMEQIQKAYDLNKNSTVEILPKLIANESISIGSMLKYFDRSALNVIVIANEKDEQFIYSSLREIASLYDNVEKSKSYQLLVIGEPSWKYLERINFEYYDYLRLHIPDNFYVERADDKNKDFEEGYRDRYGIAPREFTYAGFDIMMYFGRMLKKYGTAFPDYFDKEIAVRRHTSFSFMPVTKNVKQLDSKNIIEKQRIERFENQYLNIIKFEEFEFKPAGIKLD